MSGLPPPRLQNTEQVKTTLKSVLGKHKSKYADIPFPAPVPPPPPAEQRHILVAGLSGYGGWDSHTLPLLEYLAIVPDAIDTVVIENHAEVWPGAGVNKTQAVPHDCFWLGCHCRSTHFLPTLTAASGLHTGRVTLPIG